jgi:hypothetical protein
VGKDRQTFDRVIDTPVYWVTLIWTRVTARPSYNLIWPNKSSTEVFCIDDECGLLADR